MIINTLTPERISTFLIVHSHKKLQTANIKKCTHLSIKGTATLGTFAAGIKQAKNMKAVHSIAIKTALLLLLMKKWNRNFIQKFISAGESVYE